MERTKGSGFDEEGPGNVQVGIPLYLGSVIYLSMKVNSQLDTKAEICSDFY